MGWFTYQNSFSKSIIQLEKLCHATHTHTYAWAPWWQSLSNYKVLRSQRRIHFISLRLMKNEASGFVYFAYPRKQWVTHTLIPFIRRRKWTQGSEYCYEPHASRDTRHYFWSIFRQILVLVWESVSSLSLSLNNWNHSDERWSSNHWSLKIPLISIYRLRSRIWSAKIQCIGEEHDLGITWTTLSLVLLSKAKISCMCTQDEQLTSRTVTTVFLLIDSSDWSFRWITVVKIE